MGKILSYGQNPFLVIKVGRSSGNVSDSLGLQLPLGIFLTNSWKSGAILNTENGLYPERMLRSEIASKPWVARFQKSGYGPILLLSTDEPQPERIQKNDEYFCQFIFVSDISSFLCGLSNILLLICRLFLKFIEDQAAPSWTGYFYAFSMFLLGCLQTLFEQRYMYMCLVLGLRLRTALTGLVYRKVRLQLLLSLVCF